MKSTKFKYTLFFLLFGFIHISLAQEAIKDIHISLDFVEQHNTKTIIATVTDANNEAVPDLEMNMYVERTFGLLPIGDFFNMTDENGILEIEFPADLPGDTEGNVLVWAKVSEAEGIRNKSVSKSINWGIKTLALNNDLEKRSLWAAAANAPISLILIVMALIVAVWYVIFYVLYNFYKIKKTTFEI